MTTSDEVLRAYQATRVQVLSASDPQEALGEGGQLAERFEERGADPLLALLRSTPNATAVRLEDGDLVVEVRATPQGADVQVSWGGVSLPEQPMHPAAARSVPSVTGGSLGSAAFRRAHGVRMAYVAGAMAGGIASADLVVAMSNAGLLGFFGAGGLPVPAVEAALVDIKARAEGAWGFNLLNNPHEPAVEEATVDLYLAHGVRRVSASAYMDLSPAVVRYRFHGIHEVDGEIVTPNHVFAKVSRAEVAEKFLQPARPALLKALVDAGHLTKAQAKLAAKLPVAEDITAEADSGGHTDHRALVALVPELQALRDRISEERGYDALGVRPRVGAAGGLGTPRAVWAAFAMGADYVLTGSVNQATIEAGTSLLAKSLLADAGPADVASGPAPDMFELGAKVQVLSRGAMYAQRAQRLYDTWKLYPSIEAIPAKDRKKLEKQLFQRPLDEVWEETRSFWQERDPSQVARAETDERHRMALVFRWYLGLSSRWARIGDESRKRDFQIWCGPSMGAFNRWAAGGPLEALESRTVVAVADALMSGAADEAKRAVSAL